MRRFSRDVVASVVHGAATLALLTLIVLYAFQAGAPTLARPSTVLTNSHWVQRGAVPYLLFLQDVAQRVPRGATIILVESSATKPEDITIHLLLALSQLPDQSVVPAYARILDARAHPPGAYAAYFGGELRAHTYQLRWRSSAGTLYEAVR